MSKLSTSLGRSGNPALTSEVFNKSITSQGEVMTLQGTVNKTTLSLFLLVLSGAYTFYTANLDFIYPGLIGGFIVAMITIFKKEWAPITVPIYAVLEGLALGGISLVYDNLFPGEGLAMKAILLTVSIFAALLFAYKTRIIKPTANFKLGIFAATAGIAIFYVISLVIGLFGGGYPEVLNPLNGGFMSIGFSLFVVVIAALNLVLDFDFIEEGAEKGAPKYMEWYGAFGLLITLVWLYLEILRLLAKISSRD